MAIITLTLPDEIWEKYGKMDPDSPRRAAEKQLTRFAEAEFDNRVIVISGDARRRLEEAFGRTIGSVEELTRWVEAFRTFQVEGCLFDLSDGQLKSLNVQANKVAATPEEFLSLKVREALSNQFGG